MIVVNLLKQGNMLSEYGNPEKIASASEAYMEEHFEPVIKDKAIQALSLV